MKPNDLIAEPHCPFCQEPMTFIEVCDSDEDERKTSWSCLNKKTCDGNHIVYLVEFLC